MQSILLSVVIFVTSLNAFGEQTMNNVTVLIESLTGFEQRLLMIDRAQKSIDIETYIFLPDEAGRLLLQALVQKAKQGVEVRILLDNSGERGLNLSIAEALRRNNIQIRYFNPPMAKFLGSIGHRNHQKLFIVDKLEVVAGGRNIAAHNFGLDNQNNFGFVDREIHVTGPVVSEAVKTFEEFWNHEIVKELRPKQNDISKIDENLLTPTESDRTLRATVASRGRLLLEQSKKFLVPKIRFLADGPSSKSQDRRVTPVIHEKFRSAAKKLIIESWLYIPTSEKQKIFQGLIDRGVQIEVLTNSYASTIEPTFVALALPREVEDAKRGIALFNLTGDLPAGEHPYSTGITKWGAHTKNFVIDGKDTFIGTYNLDPRSQNINCEDGFLIEDQPEIAALIEDSIRARITTAKRVQGGGTYADGVSVEEGRPDGWRASAFIKISDFFSWALLRGGF